MECARNINLLPSDNVIIDTNVWQYIYGIEASENDYGYSDVVYEHVLGRCWYPVNKIDNLNRDFFVLCHD